MTITNDDFNEPQPKTPISDAERLFIQAAYKVKEALASHDISYFNLKFKISGRCSAGDLKFEVSLSESDYGTEVSLSTLDATLAEFIRRNAVTKRHGSLCLPAVEPKVETAFDL